MRRKFSSFKEFYPFYLGEHRNRTCVRLHFIGTTLAAVLILSALWKAAPLYLLAALLCGYAFAWVGHFFFEKNRPATFAHPIYSFIGDWVMWKDVLLGHKPF
jgi:hypothetical protein